MMSVSCSKDNEEALAWIRDNFGIEHVKKMWDRNFDLYRELCEAAEMNQLTYTFDEVKPVLIERVKAETKYKSALIRIIEQIQDSAKYQFSDADSCGNHTNQEYYDGKFDTYDSILYDIGIILHDNEIELSELEKD